jgi:hypothetical protein
MIRLGTGPIGPGGWVRRVARILMIVLRHQVDLAADDLGDRGCAHRVFVREQRLMVEPSAPVR